MELELETNKRLQTLADAVSKHSQYQSLPKRFAGLVKFPVEIKINHFDNERFNFIKEEIDFSGNTVLDIGGNCGYFTFAALDENCSAVTMLEGNSQHAHFVSELSQITNSGIEVLNKYLNFKEALPKKQYDIVFNLNVVHHLGDDFGNKRINIENAKVEMAQTFAYLADRCRFMAFQMGYCWKGDKTKLLFPNGSKSEMIEFVSNASRDIWTIKSVGIAEQYNGVTTYKYLNAENLKRMDELGEFRNRPIFILESNRISRL